MSNSRSYFRIAGPTATLLVAVILLSQPFAAAVAGVDFNEQIRPILSDKCFFCHGPDPETREADLRLDVRQDAIDYLAIVPGEPAESELIRRIEETDPELRMPPPHAKRSISPEEIALLKQWIAEKAPYQEHWSFNRLEPTEVPRHPDSDWPASEIDQFVLKRMREKGLEPSAPAQKAALLRRVTFDLTGLPPTLEELDAFLADESPNAYEKVVDRLLASPAYGERMTAEWLDVARYSDTYGYQVDRDRYVWPWRDWVIRAFNANKPYDEFVTEQLAGDLLPNATDDQILATTFNRLHPQKVEGGSVPEEFRVEYVSDRTQTVATAFLGLTLECARCHTHKYDPLTQTEYYQLSSFFDNIDEAGLYSYFTNAVPTPNLLLASDEQKASMASLRDKIAQQEQELADLEQQTPPGFKAWWDNSRPLKPEPVLLEESTPAPAADPELIPGRIAHLDFEEWKDNKNIAVPGVKGQAIKLTGDDAVNLDVGNFQRFQPFSVALWMQTPDVKERAVIFHRSRAWTDAASRGYELLIEEGHLAASLIHFWPGNALSVKTKEPIPTGEWLHVAVTYDGSIEAAGLQIWVNGQPAELDVVRDELTKNITGGGGDNIAIGERFRDRGFKNGLVDEFQVFERELTPLEVGQLHDGTSLVNLLQQPLESLGKKERRLMEEYYRSTVGEVWQKKQEELRQARQKLCDLVDPIPEIMVMREKSEPHQTYLLQRGVYDARGEAVESAVPAALHPFPEDAPRNRLGLARWLMSRDNPLTARVTVNRYWQMLFGQGIVKTPEDFGSQGAVPSHPQLLDWLALDFMTHGWDLKRLMKQIVISSTYRQTSRVTAESLAKDPVNIWLSRYPAHRLPAEMLRDNALAVSGLLVDKIGGDPVKPYELEDAFKPTPRSKGEGLYRRSLYTYWKRTSPAPAMTTFDAAKRDVCQLKRDKTSSPLQAFIMLNGPQYVEAARSLAERTLKQHPDDVSAGIESMFRLLTARVPSEQEQTVLNELHALNADHFAKNPEAATSFLGIGDKEFDKSLNAGQLAAMSIVASTLLNYDECMMQR
ncbi:DUF1553 domain-containing protein [Rubinisphaera margarita]|uniref:DUF1553 domain-containing protein n=1 Tax=Rubinisphaera margarita TaxID=2909586 RepID=UPI001EE8D5CA|nr:DUF1553 domain-containing protein [Rubinisphaera margarita]MCG6155405.1 DUF1553 domain-containing protein [Rubinisphaera margarita]